MRTIMIIKKDLSRGLGLLKNIRGVQCACCSFLLFPPSNGPSESLGRRQASGKLPRTMYTQAQGHTNHGPQKKREKKNKIQKTQLIDPKELNVIPSLFHAPLPNPELNSTFRAFLHPCSHRPLPVGRSRVALSGWCIWRREPPRPHPTGRYSTARTPGLSRACPAFSWTPWSQSQSFCRIYIHIS